MTCRGHPNTHTSTAPDTLRGASASFKTNGHRTGVYGMRKSAAVTVGQNSDMSEFCQNPVANNQVTPRRQYDSFEVYELDKSTTGAISGSNISVHTTCGASFLKKSKGSHTEKNTPKIENGSDEALRPAPGVVDSLESQNLEKLPNTGSDGFYTIGSLTEKRLTRSFREQDIGDGPSKMQYADNFSTQIWQLSISGNVPGWRKRRGENGSSYPWVRTLMDTRL